MVAIAGSVLPKADKNGMVGPQHSQQQAEGMNEGENDQGGFEMRAVQRFRICRTIDSDEQPADLSN